MLAQQLFESAPGDRGQDVLRQLMAVAKSGQDTDLRIGMEMMPLQGWQAKYLLGVFKAIRDRHGIDKALEMVGNYDFVDHALARQEAKLSQMRTASSVPGERGVGENIVAGIVGHEIEKFLDEPNPKVAEGGVLKSIKRGMQGWDKKAVGPSGEKLGDPKEIVKRAKAMDTDTAKKIRSGLDDAPEHTPAGLQKRVLDRKLKGVSEGSEEDNPVANAIINRILRQRPDLLSTHGPERLGDAIASVAEFVGNVEEIGSSDVSGWVRQVERELAGDQGVAEAADKKKDLDEALPAWDGKTVVVYDAKGNMLDRLATAVAAQKYGLKPQDIQTQLRTQEFTSLQGPRGTFTVGRPIVPVEEGWKEKLAGATIGAAAIGGIGSAINAASPTYVDGVRHEMSFKVPDGAQQTVDDKGRKVYVWSVQGHGIKSGTGRTNRYYHPAEQVKEQGVAEEHEEYCDACDRVMSQCICNDKSVDQIEEDLRKWFKEKWVRFGPDGKIRGDCARGDDSEGKPKCLPQSKAHALGKKGRASAAAKKRREDPNPERRGPAKNVATKVREDKKECPPATQDIALNLENRQKAIDEYGYGPLNPAMPNVKFWAKKVDEWNLDSAEEAKQSLCGNCAAFDMTSHMLDCIAQGIGSEPGSDPHDTIEAGHLGYCKFLKFKCASERTCDAWVTGGPITDDKPEVTEEAETCPDCGGPMFSELLINEKQDACYYKVKSRYKVWPSAYASGALVQCRKKGAKNWGNKSESVAEGSDDDIWGPQGNFAGDNPVNISTTVSKKPIAVGQLVKVADGNIRGIGEVQKIKDDRAQVWIDSYARSFVVPLSALVAYSKKPAAEVEENFADGKKPGRKGLAKRMGVPTKASVSTLRKIAKNSTGEKQRMAHWMANMKAGKQKNEEANVQENSPLADRLSQLHRVNQGLEEMLQAMRGSRKKTEEDSKTKQPEPPEADYGDEYQAMVKRVGALAKQGPRKTVWDPEKRVYKTVPINGQDKK